MALLLLFLLEDSFDAKLQEGLAALNRNDLSAARASLESASQIQPENPRAWVGLAQVHFRSGDARSAEATAQKAERLCGSDPVALYGLAMFRLQSGAPKLSIALAQRLISLEDRSEAHNLLGKALDAAGDTDKALPELERAIQMNRFEESYYFDLAQTLLRHQKFDGAIRALEPARKIFAKSPQLELVLGVAYYGQRRFAEAVDCFLRVIAIAPDVEQPYAFLARVLDHAAARLEEVSARFAVFAASQPDNYLAQYVHGKTMSNADEAEQSLRRSIRLRADFADSHFELGSVLERKRQWSRAALEFERAAELSPKDSAPHYRLSRLYDRMGQAERAKSERVLHEKLSAEETAAMDRQVAAFTLR